LIITQQYFQHQYATFRELLLTIVLTPTPVLHFSLYVSSHKWVFGKIKLRGYPEDKMAPKEYTTGTGLEGKLNGKSRFLWREASRRRMRN